MKFAHYAFLCLWVLGSLATSAPAESVRTGEQIYRDLCVKCHGPKGEGVAGKQDEPLYGDRSVESLARLIARTMPEDNPGTCTGEDAKRVAAYIYDAFYSPEARLKSQPAKIQLARLTVNQYRNSIADLLGSFRSQTSVGQKRGLEASYHSSRNFRGDKKAFDRLDPSVHFQFADGSPDTNKIAPPEFSIRWRGALLAEDTGVYEFALESENGVRLYLNGDKQPLIDGWVSSGGNSRELRESMFLIGGRAYPIQVEFFKFKEKTASISLKWKAPHKAFEVIPERNLAPDRPGEITIVTTSFPPDDSSVGYERGTSVSKAWDEATTTAAIEVANGVLEQLDTLSGSKPGDSNRVARLKDFCYAFAEKAFRAPLTPEQKRLFVDSHFKGSKEPPNAVKRAVMFVLKSPRFLYPGIGDDPLDHHIATRLALTLWDSLPDATLSTAAQKKELHTPEQVEAAAQRMLKDPRTRAKIREFFHHWLDMEEAEDISKDKQAFPDFTDNLLADLRTSLDLFLDEIVWSEQSDYRQLLMADYLYLNKPLAKFYGHDAPEEEGFVKVAFKSRERSGVITHPYLLSAFAYHKSSSPIHRGVFLTRKMLGRALKPPPMAIEFMDGRFDPSLTMREKVSELTRPAACQTCHSMINPLGFSLEHYDAVGRYRTRENEKPIDATGEYTSTDGKSIRITGARDVAEYAANSPEAHRGFVQQLFHHLVKQPAGAYGQNTLEDLRRFFASNNYHMQKLIVEIAKRGALQPISERKTTKPSAKVSRKQT